MNKVAYPYSVSMGILEQIIRYLSHLNVDVEQFLVSVGIEPRLLKCPDERISVEKYIFIEEMAAQATKDPYFGLHMGQFVEAGNWSILGYMMMNCKNVLEAFKKFSKYSNVIGNLIKGEMCFLEDTLTIYLTEPIDAPKISKHCYEGYFSSIICLVRALTGSNICPLEVGFAYPEPKAMDAYHKVFGSKVLFLQVNNYMIMDRKSINTPVLLPNNNLLEHFEKYAKEFLLEIEDERIFTYKTKKLLISYMDDENLSVSSVAKELAISVRTLQIYLKNEGTEFSTLLKQTREQLAKKYLQENYTVEDITYLLGFSDPSVFRKAFKKWMGITPKQYREKTCMDFG